MSGRPKGIQKTGGRKAGTPNKRTMELVERISTYDMDPFDILFAFARGDWKALGYDNEVYHREGPDGATTMGYVISPELRAKSAKDACEYVFPKRKSIDMIIDDDEKGKAMRAKELLAMDNEKLAEETRKHLMLVASKDE